MNTLKLLAPVFLVMLLSFGNSEKNNPVSANGPSIEKMKNDLIGKKMPNWAFDGLSEFRGFTIIDSLKDDNQIMYTVDLTLYDASVDKIFKPTINITYTKSHQNEGWDFAKVELVKWVFNVPAVLNGWRNIWLIENCNFTFGDASKKMWLLDCCSKKKYKIGGDDGEAWSVVCDSIKIMSREKNAFPVDIIYSEIPGRTKEMLPQGHGDAVVPKKHGAGQNAGTK